MPEGIVTAAAIACFVTAAAVGLFGRVQSAVTLILAGALIAVLSLIP